jgi:hypothetical protein
MKNVTYEEGLVIEIENPAGKQGYDVVVLELTKFNATRFYCSLKPGEELKRSELLFGRYKVVAIDMRRRVTSLSGKFSIKDRSQVTVKVDIFYHVTNSRTIAIEIEDPLEALRHTVESAIRREMLRYSQHDIDPLLIENIALNIPVSHLGFALENIMFLEFDKEVTKEIPEGNYQLAMVDQINWRLELVRKLESYSCYCLFLVLPSDKEAIRYLTEFSNELRIISIPNTLVLALGSNQHLRSDVSGKVWSSAIERDINKGYSAQIASAFNIDYTEFPCLVVLKSLNSSEQISISLKRMTAEEIADKMRLIFSVIQKAITEEKSPLDAIQRQRNNERLKNSGKSLISELRSITSEAFHAIMEAWINAKIK